MELMKINDRNTFGPTLKLKSSPVPILFISFNRNDTKCINCGERYITAQFCDDQRYCKICLSNYLINNITDINIHLDIYYTTDLKCNGHEIIPKESQNIQERCGNCLKILCFKQLPSVYTFNLDYILFERVIESKNYCRLCGKLLYQGAKISIKRNFKLFSDCYVISFGYLKSILTKKPILPWWHNISCCDACNTSLTFTSDCQKYCEKCLIFYIGCNYCLTTNIIFGLTTQSQCKRCKRVSDIMNILSGNNELDDSILDLRPEIYNNLRIELFSNKIIINDKYFLPSEINTTIHLICQDYKNTHSKRSMEWIPYSQFTNVAEIAKGGFGTIYRATRIQKNVILKKFKNSKDTSKYFLNELKSNQNCYKIKHHIIRTHGITKDPKSGDYILVMQYASGGDLHNCLETIHKADYIHRDFHSGNILHDLFHNNSKKRFIGRHQWLIGDLGLSQPTNNTSLNSEIYGVIPYIAPEIFKGSPFSKESDVYSIGMIMWELTTGCKPFANVEHDINLILRILDGERPEVTEDTPECYVDLMKSCWDPDPKKRPLVEKVRNTLEKLGPEFAKKPHPKAIYTSRPLSSFISKCSSINSYISQDLEFDINIRSGPLNESATLRKRKIEKLNVKNNGKKRFCG
ncbi:hypothetical protein RclHR1_14090009 [Rhizophagus clarus]|uniref:Protein kinase domain-containing protein n=1 Tax=Rhizophagus clarus TaxID=94130 RepID=A0A2Z6QBP1_9GLOM|nr:hypothetical protein RclHR1_14090009 [Rhizophagus clarus]